MCSIDYIKVTMNIMCVHQLCGCDVTERNSAKDNCVKDSI